MTNHSSNPAAAPRRRTRAFSSRWSVPSSSPCLLFLHFFSCLVHPTLSHDKTIISYYPSWQWYDRGHHAKPSNLDVSKVTRYNFAFFQINEQGDIWGTDSWADPIVLFGEFDWSGTGQQACSWDAPGEPPVCAAHHYQQGLLYLAHQAGVEVYPSIGGWTLSEPFPAMAANEAARRKFASNCVKLIRDYGFDGIDIDWEYPGYAPHAGTPEDTENYSLLLKDIRRALDQLGSETGKFYGLTAALPCGPDLIDNIQIDVVRDYMTEFNLMTYDFFGSWSPTTGVNAPLYDQDGGPGLSVHGCVNNWLAGGAKPEQINIGFPFYGRSYSGIGLTGLYQPHDGAADTITWSDDEGSPQFFNIMAKISQFTTFRDEQTKTQIAYNSYGLVSYDDEVAICDKTEYAMKHGLNGYIIWEATGDVMPDLSTPLLDAAVFKLNNPDVPCSPESAEDEGADSDAENPWYAKKTTDVCINDGKHDKNLPDTQLYESMSKCCKAAFAWDPDGCMAASTHGTSAGKWYVHMGGCISEGNIPDWIDDSDIFATKEECCSTKLNWNLSACLGDGESTSDVATAATVASEESSTTSTIMTTSSETSTATSTESVTTTIAAATSTSSTEVLTTTSAEVTTTTSAEVKTTTSSVEATSTEPITSTDTTSTTSIDISTTTTETKSTTPIDTTGRTTTDATSTSSTETTSTTTELEILSVTDDVEEQSEAFESWTNDDSSESSFYPYYGKDGTEAKCRSDGNFPDWFSKSEAADSRASCCETFFLPSQFNDCMMESIREARPYYPNFEDMSCKNDGKQPDYMGLAGDYLLPNKFSCCNNFFSSDRDLMMKCTG